MRKEEVKKQQKTDEGGQAQKQRQQWYLEDKEKPFVKKLVNFFTFFLYKKSVC